MLQKIKIKSQTDSELGFILISNNKISKEKTKIEGVAKNNDDGDPKIDEDEKGLAYPSQEYSYVSETCILKIRVDLETKDKVQIREYDCEIKEGGALHSVGILRKKKARC